MRLLSFSRLPWKLEKWSPYLGCFRWKTYVSVKLDEKKLGKCLIICLIWKLKTNNFRENMTFWVYWLPWLPVDEYSCILVIFEMSIIRPFIRAITRSDGFIFDFCVIKNPQFKGTPKFKRLPWKCCNLTVYDQLYRWGNFTIVFSTFVSVKKSPLSPIPFRGETESYF